MFKKHILIITLLIFCSKLFSQAGTGVYTFLDLPVSSRLAALGGTNISINDNDINFAFQNPALLTVETNNVIGLNMANYLADIKFGSAMYARNLDKKNFFAVGIQYVDYGTFKETTELNEILGEFTAKDMAINIIYARPITKRITVGATLKPIYSVYERYSSFGLALDAGVSYNDPVHFFSAGLVVKNAGTQLKGYYSDETGQHYEPLPFNIQLGATKKLAHAPLRFSLNLHNLQRWDLNYSTLNLSGANNSTTKVSNISFLDMAFRHAVIGLEFLPGKNFYLATSYNHRRHQELTMNGFKSMAGFSFGGGVKLYKFQVGFGMSQYQVGNYSYQFSISTSLNEFRL
ncbi:MAG TPA: type IX secretion system protein PorQ [Paludibacter sp.]|nr:type IX secretion system protein PorQ [Paludibacter sp.]